MDFEFYNRTSRHSRYGIFLIPAQRLLRRVLRPMFFQLRDLLIGLYEKQLENNQEIRREIQELRSFSAMRESQLEITLTVCRERIGSLENALQQTLSDNHRKIQEYQSKIIDLSAALQSALSANTALKSDHNGLTGKLSRMDELIRASLNHS